MNTLIQARAATESAAIEIVDQQPIPTDIQWMPPGTHTIVAMAGNAPKRLTVTVDEAVANRLANQLVQLRAKAISGPADLPYTDFNHDDREASGRPLALSWGGTDPIKGGIRAKMDWTQPGEAALRGRAYRRFSPQFLLDKAGQIAGIGLNMGGLVNKAAFQTIAPIAAKAGGQAPTNNEKMDELKTQLAELTAKLTALTADVTEIKAKSAQAPAPATVAELQAKVTALTEANATIVKARAQEVVNAAIQAGRLAPQDTASHAQWVGLIVVDAKNAELLNAIPVNPALAGRVIQAGKASDAPNQDANSPAAKFATEVKAKKAELKSASAALQAVIASNPEGHKAWVAESAKYPLA